MPTTPFTHFVFVDFENVSDVDLGPLAELPVNVTLLIGKKQSALPAKLVEQITQFPCEVRLVKVGVTRKNALDFSLAFHLGQMSGRHPDAQFHIVSRDKRDFDMIADHMRTHQVRVARVDSIAALPFLPQPKPHRSEERLLSKDPVASSKSPAEARFTKVVASLKNPASKNRSPKEPRLRAYIETALGKHYSADLLEKVLWTLRHDRVFTIEPGGKVIWQ